MMKKLLAIVFAAAATAASLPAAAQVGVSIGIHQPGVYGRINIGDIPRPALVLPQPVIIAPQPVRYERAPIYLYVPPTHQQNWRRYCGNYGACGQPVYFVQDRWVRERYEEAHSHGDRGRQRGWDKKDKHHKNDKHDKHGRGNGRGHGRDH